MELQVDAIDRLAVGYSVDYLEVGTADKVVLTPGANPPVIGANDNLVVTPYQSATSIDYNIPQSVVQGLAEVAAIREDLLIKLTNLELAIVEAQQYRDLVADDVRNQIFTEMSANYLSNASMPEAVQAQILATDLSNMAIATGAGGTTASFQQIADRYVEVGEAVGGFTEQLNVNTTAASSAVAATEVLTAKVDGVETTVSTAEYVAVGGYTQYTTGTPVTGQWRGTAGSREQYRGDMWVSITEEQHIRYTKQLAIAGAKSLSVVGGTIVGWEYTNGGAGDNEFKIKADKFYLEAAGSSTKQSTYVPFSVDATSGEINFNGKVTFSSVTGTSTHTSGVIADRPAAPTVGSTYTATDEYDAIYTYTNTGWKQNGVAAGALNTELARNTTVIDGGRIATSTITADKIDTKDLIAENILSTSVISGNVINGCYINGSVIKASFIDLSTTITLTNWQLYTPSTIPASYAANFAYQNDGTLLTDSSGYVRLAGDIALTIQANSYSNNYVSNSGYFPSVNMPLYSIGMYTYDDYKSDTLQRAIQQVPILSASESKPIVFASISSYAHYNSTSIATISCTVLGISYELTSTATTGSTVGVITSSTYSILVNGVKSASNTIVVDLGGISITIFAGVDMYGNPLCYVSSSTMATSQPLTKFTTVSHGHFGKLFELTKGTATHRWSTLIDVPRITVN